MKEIAILGRHPVYGEVIIDLLKETYGPVRMKLFLNIALPYIGAAISHPDIPAIHPSGGYGVAEGLPLAEVDLIRRIHPGPAA